MGERTVERGAADQALRGETGWRGNLYDWRKETDEGKTPGLLGVGRPFGVSAQR